MVPFLHGILICSIFSFSSVIANFANGMTNSAAGEDVVDSVDLFDGHNLNDEGNGRAKRETALQYPTIYYVCGEFPNLVYTTTRECQKCFAP